MHIKRLVLLAIMFAAPQAAGAQSTWTPYIGPWDYGAGAMAETNLQNVLIEQQMESDAGDTQAERGPAAASNLAAQRAPTAVSARVLRFTPSAQRRRANLASFVEKHAATDPAGARALQQQFAAGDVIGMMGQALAPLGLRVDNLADAYAAYWITAWNISHGQDSSPTAGQMQAVKRQTEQAMAAVPELAGASDADKQQTAEAFLVQAAMMQSMFDNATGAAQRQQLAAAVRQGASASGIDLDVLQLTENGFVQR